MIEASFPTDGTFWQIVAVGIAAHMTDGVPTVPFAVLIASFVPRLPCAAPVPAGFAVFNMGPGR
jgi:hypothetical protein